MHKYLVIITLALFAGFAAFAQAGERVCEKCEFHKHSPGTGLAPAIQNEVCFDFVQDGRRFVTLTLYDVYEGEHSPNNHIIRQLKHQVPDGERGQFCLGAQKYVSHAVWVDVCNDINHSDRGVPSITKGLQTGHVEMCLLGKACTRYVEHTY